MADEQTPPPEPDASETSSDAASTPPDQVGNEGQDAEQQPAPPAGDETAGDEGEAPGEETAEPAPAVAEEPAAEETAAPDEPAAEEPAPAVAEEPVAEETAASDEPAAEEPAPAAAAGEEPRRQRPPRREEEQPEEPAVVPGAHLEPDLVLEEKRPAEGEYADPYADPTAAADDDTPVAEGEPAASVDETPARTPLELAADARYRATGKRKRAIARVILKPGEGTYTINGKGLDVYFPRVTLQRHARLPLETTGNDARMDVVAKIHGGGVSAQATALRHGIARALVEADPNLRGELKRHGFLTRDARVKERKKAGLKKARKRPQFSKR
jgi:small subunit ribosomal protein S9